MLLNINRLGKEDIKFFIGYSGWGSGQLEDEIGEDSWIITQAQADFLFTTEPADFWRNILKNMGNADINISGILNAEFQAKNLYTSPSVIGDISIEDLMFNNEILGQFNTTSEWSASEKALKIDSEIIHHGKQNAFAVLGKIVGSDTLVVASLETHSTHPGWHLHGDCKMSNAVSGRMRWPDGMRIPGKARRHSSVAGLISANDVLVKASKVFRLP